VFSPEDRDRVQAHILELAQRDDRVVGAALLGSLAAGRGDRWSDVDLMLAIEDAQQMSDVMRSFTDRLAQDYEAVPLFDLPRDPIIYRVFVLPNSLELDLSTVPAESFGASGPRFRPLFGDPVDLPTPSDDPPEEVFGYAVHHVLHAAIAIKRGRYWLAEFWISAARDRGLVLACRRRGLDGSYARDFDQLPADVRETFAGALVRSLEPGELRRALGHAVEGLLLGSTDVAEMAGKVEGILREALSMGIEEERR
jgi:predicted nucleotidyltransferase